MCGDDNQVDIQPDPADFTYGDLLKFGFEQVEKGVYEKLYLHLNLQIFMP